MPIIRAHIATFPPRRQVLEKVLRSLLPQVDEIHLVLNEYDEIPGFIAKMNKVNPILRDEDYKDTGKFITDAGEDDLVFLVDDDLEYSLGYCKWMISLGAETGLERAVFGLHSCIYKSAEAGKIYGRKRLHYRRGLRRSFFADQLGTGTVFAKGKNIAPFDFMIGSEMFVDVRYAGWCHENGIKMVSLARPFNMIRPLRPDSGSIYRDYTMNQPERMLEEIGLFAAKNEDSGKPFGKKISLSDLFFGAEW